MSCDMNVKDIHVQCLTNSTYNYKKAPIHCKNYYVITVDQVKFAINKLKFGKADIIDGLLSDFKKGTPLLYKYIAFLFNCILTLVCYRT